MNRPLVVAGAAAPAAALAVAAQALWTARRARPDLHPSYDVEALAAPAQWADPDASPVEVVFLGDSTAAGVGAPTVSGSLPALVAERVADRLGRPVHVVGHGVSGERTAGVTADQVPRVRGPVDVVTVVVGTNDVTGLTPPWKLRRDTRDLVDAVHRAGGAPLVLAGIPLFGGPLLRPPLLWVAAAYAKVLRGVQRRAARRPAGAAGATPGSVRLVGIAREASPRFAGRPEAMSGDGYHPSPVGYGFWADAIAPAVADAYAGAAGTYSASR